MNLTDIGRFIFIFGIVLLISGALIYLLGSLGLKKIPGDIMIKKDGLSIYIAIGLSILLSLILTIVINLIFYLKK